MNTSIFKLHHSASSGPVSSGGKKGKGKSPSGSNNSGGNNNSGNNKWTPPPGPPHPPWISYIAYSIMIIAYVVLIILASNYYSHPPQNHNSSEYGQNNAQSLKHFSRIETAHKLFQVKEYAAALKYYNTVTKEDNNNGINYTDSIKICLIQVKQECKCRKSLIKKYKNGITAIATFAELEAYLKKEKFSSYAKQSGVGMDDDIGTDLYYVKKEELNGLNFEIKLFVHYFDNTEHFYCKFISIEVVSFPEL